MRYQFKFKFLRHHKITRARSWLARSWNTEVQPFIINPSKFSCEVVLSITFPRLLLLFYRDCGCHCTFTHIELWIPEAATDALYWFIPITSENYSYSISSGEEIPSHGPRSWNLQSTKMRPASLPPSLPRMRLAWFKQTRRRMVNSFPMQSSVIRAPVTSD